MRRTFACGIKKPNRRLEIVKLNKRIKSDPADTSVKAILVLGTQNKTGRKKP